MASVLRDIKFTQVIVQLSEILLSFYGSIS